MRGIFAGGHSAKAVSPAQKTCKNRVIFSENRVIFVKNELKITENHAAQR
jgi:hypothetical protein